MMIRALFVLAWTACDLMAATVTVCPSGYPGAPCTYSDLQTALNGVACGNELQIAAVYWDGNFTWTRSCAGNPVTLTSMRKAWLPATNTRISPAHMTPVAGVTGSTGNVPTLRMTVYGSTGLTFACILDATMQPCSGLHIAGMAFTYSYGNRSTPAAGIIAIGNDFAAETATIPDDVSFDRTLVIGTPNNHAGVAYGIEALGTNLVVKNSFFSDIWNFGLEAQGVQGCNVLGPETYTNNFFATAGIPVYHGGGVCSWLGDNLNIPNTSTLQYNYLYSWPKWNDSIMSPEYRLFKALGFYIGAGAPCVKNRGEMKNDLNGLWQYNVHENAWGTQGGCSSNNFGFTYSPRGQNFDSLNGCCTWLGDLNVTDPTHANYTGTNGTGTGSIFANYKHHLGTVASSTAAGSSTLALIDASRVPDPATASCSPNCRLQIDDLGGTIQAIKYTGKSSNTLTGIPTSGAGSIASTLPQYAIVYDYEPIWVNASACVQWVRSSANQDVECRKIVAADYDSKSIAVASDPTYGGWTQTGSGLRWMFMAGWKQSLTNFRVENSVFRNAYLGSTFLSHGLGIIGAASIISNGTFKQNLLEQNNYAYTIGPGYLLASTDEPYVVSTGSNDALTVSWNGFQADSQSLTVPAGSYTAAQMVAYLNANLRRGLASAYTYNTANRFVVSAANVATGYNVIGCSGSFATAFLSATYGSNASAPISAKITVAESSATQGDVNSGPLDISHNTWYLPDSWSPGNSVAGAQWFSGTSSNTSKMDGFRFHSNILTPSIYGFKGSTYNDWASMATADTTTNSIFANNSIPKNPSYSPFSIGTCAGGRVCTGNILTQQTLDDQLMAGSYKAIPGGAFARAGYDGKDIGADPAQLPLINNLTVKPASEYAVFDWDLTAVNNTIPCVLEVSTDVNLIEDMAAYAVVTALDPTLFLQPDSSARTNAKLVAPITTGLHHTMQAGQHGTVADDNTGATQGLALASGTQHYYRLMCGGDTRWGKFMTLPSASSLNASAQAKVSMVMDVPTGTTTVRLLYGTTSALGSQIDFTPSGGKATVLVPVTPGVTTYYQIQMIGTSTVTTPLATL